MMGNTSTLKDIGEKGVLEQLRKYIGSSPPLVRTFSEDCAVVDPGGDEYELFTVDALIEGVHFQRAYVPSFYIGRKALKVNISDISSMGGTPSYLLVSLGAPSGTSISMIDEIYQGIISVAGDLKIQLAGGNISRSPVLFLEIFLAGKVLKKRILMRNGAREDDLIFLTGRVGAAAEGLKLLNDGFRLLGDGLKFPAGQLDSRYVREAIMAQIDPPCLSKTARELAGWGLLHSMIDLSDGIASDLFEICKESEVGARVNLEKVPVAPSVLHWEKKRKLDPRTLALGGGEDYQLLFTVPRKKRRAFLDRVKKAEFEVFEIGEIVHSSKGVSAVDTNGKHRELGSGYQHFL